MRVTLTSSAGNYGKIRERMLEMATEHLVEIAQDGARFGEQAAERFARGRTPGTTYTATVDRVSPLPIVMTLEAQHEDDKADMLFRIANTGRRAYTVRPVSKRALAFYDAKAGEDFVRTRARIPKMDGDNFFARACDSMMRHIRRRS